MRNWVVASLLTSTAAYAGSSIRLVNDSAFTLQATIISSEGNVMASRTIPPQDFYQWSYQAPVQQGNFNPLSPFTVVWRCTDGKEFGVSTYVGNAQWAQASTSSGPQYCLVKQQPPTEGNRGLAPPPSNSNQPSPLEQMDD